MAKKELRLRRDDVCIDCGQQLTAGTSAEWDSTAKVVTCMSCVGMRPSSGAAAGHQPDSEAPELETHSSADEWSQPPLDSGTAGASARHEYERRRANNEKRIEQTWGTGISGRIVKALSDDPQSTKAWKQGAAGEERLAKLLTKHLDDRAVLLHDREVPGTRGNIDHIAISSSGVWIIDAKRYKGKVERRDKGTMFRSDFRLYVGGRDRTKLVTGMQWQHDAVAKILSTDPDIPIHQIVTFVDAEWPLLFRRPHTFGEVRVTWPLNLVDWIVEPGLLSHDDVHRIARMLASELPSVRG